MTRRVMPRQGAALRPAFHRRAAFSTTSPALAPAAPSTPQPPSAPVPPGSTSGRQGQRHGDHQRSSSPGAGSGVNVTPPQHRTTSYPKFDDYVAFKREVRSINERRHWQTFSKAERTAASFLSDANAAMNPKTNATGSAAPSLSQQPSASTNGQVQVTGIDAAAALSTEEWQRFDTIVAKANKAVASLADDSGYAALDCVLFEAFTVNVAAGRYATAVHLLRRMADDDRAPVPLSVITAASDLLSAIAGCSGAQSSSAAPNTAPGKGELDDDAAVVEAPTPLSIALPQVFPALSISTAALAQVQGMTCTSAAVEGVDDTDGATKETISLHDAATNALLAENLRSVSIGTGAASDALLPQALGHELLLPALNACRRLGLLPTTVTSMGKYVDAKALAKILALGEAALSAKQASTIAADDLPAPVTLHGAKGSSAVNRSHAPTISDAERGIAALETVLALSTLTADAATALTESGADLTSACASADATHPGRAALLSLVASIKAIVSSVELPKTDDAAVDNTDHSRVLRESIMDNVMGALKTVTIALHTAGVAQNARCGEPITDGVSAIVNELAGVWRSVSGVAADVVLSCLKGNLPIIDDLEAAFESLQGIIESAGSEPSSSRIVSDAFAFSMLLATSVSIASASAGADLEARLELFFTRFIEGGAFDELSAVFRSHMSHEMSQDGAGFAAHFCLTPATVLRPEHFVIESSDSVELAASTGHDVIVGEDEQTSAPAADASTPAAASSAVPEQEIAKTADATSSSVDTEPAQATNSTMEDDGQSFEDSAWDDEEAHGHHAADDGSSDGTTASPQADVAAGATEASVKESTPVEDAFADEDEEWGSAEDSAHHAVAPSEPSGSVSSTHKAEDVEDQSTLSDTAAANATPSEPVLTNPIRVDLLESVTRCIDAVSDAVKKSDGGAVSELARSSVLLASCRVEWIAQHWRTAEAAAGDALRFAVADERGRASVVESVQGSSVAELESARLAAACGALDVSSLELLPAEAASQGTDTSAADAAAAEKARLADEQARLAQVFGQAAPTAAPTSPEPITSDSKASASSTTPSSSVTADIGEGKIVLAVDSVHSAVSLEVEAPLAAALQRALRRTISGNEKTEPARSSSELLYFVKAVVEVSADAAVFHHGLSNGRPLFASPAISSFSSAEVKKNASACASVSKGHSQFPYAGATDMAGGVGGLFSSTSAASSAPPALEALCPTTPTMTTSSSLDPRPSSVQYSAMALHKVSSAAQFAERSSSQHIVSAGGLLPSRRVQRVLADLVVRFMSPTTPSSTNSNNEDADDVKNVEVLAKQEFWQSLIASLAPATPIVERRPQTAAAASLALLAAAAVDATVDGRIVAAAFNATAALSVRTKLGLDASPSAATATDVSATSSSAQSTATASAFAGDFALSPEALAAIGRVARDGADVELLESVARLHPLAYDVYGAVVESMES